MRYTEFKVGDKEYKLRLAANEIVNIENKLGGSILSIFMGAKEGELPATGQLLMVLHGALQKYNHGITQKDTYDIYDDYIDEGGTFEDLLEKLMEVFEVSGFFKAEGLEKAKTERSNKE